MLHTPDGPSFPEYEELAGRITDGDGTVWQGDPFAYLQVGVIATQQGRVVGHRLEVWRWCEDGEHRRLGSWHPSEQYRIPLDLAQMRADRPGGADVLDRIDEANKAKEEQHEREAQDEMAERVERLAHHYVYDVEGNAKTTFPVEGLASGDE